MARLQRFSQKLLAVYDRFPIRTRLAGASAVLTFVILCVFAVVIGSVTVNRLRSQFDSQFETTLADLPRAIEVEENPLTGRIAVYPELPRLAGYIGGKPVIRIMPLEGDRVIAETPAQAPNLGPVNPLSLGPHVVHGYRVASRPDVRVVVVEGEEEAHVIGSAYVELGKSLAPLEASVGRVELLLLLGVLVGAALSLLVGIMIARRAMAPIAELTSTAAEIARTRDTSRSMPQPTAKDEVSELARTLSGMLDELDSARTATEATLTRQRRFVADASHELRTPLTSILANLELLADSLSGEQGEAARSALRSSQRMGRLVADLLLLARGDAGRVLQRETLDLGALVVEATAELGPISADHEIVLEAEPAAVEGVRDELYRVALNLIENAVRHTPPGTGIDVRTDSDRGQARLVVQDNGPGVPAGLRLSLFERFVRGDGDRGGSFGLGLAIVRAVAESHGGSVTVADADPVDPEHRGARFEVRLPLARSERAASPMPVKDGAGAASSARRRS